MKNACMGHWGPSKLLKIFAIKQSPQLCGLTCHGALDQCSPHQCQLGVEVTR